MKKDKTSQFSLGRTKIARLNRTQMKQIEGGSKSNGSVKGIPPSSLTCILTIVHSSKICG